MNSPWQCDAISTLLVVSNLEAWSPPLYHSWIFFAIFHRNIPQDTPIWTLALIINALPTIFYLATLNFIIGARDQILAPIPSIISLYPTLHCSYRFSPLECRTRNCMAAYLSFQIASLWQKSLPLRSIPLVCVKVSRPCGLIFRMYKHVTRISFVSQF